MGSMVWVKRTVRTTPGPDVTDKPQVEVGAAWLD